jgi:biotin synthase-related radical SAM superfamily protein
MTSKVKNQQCNLKQIKNYFYADLNNSTVQLLQANKTNTTTKKILAQLKKRKTKSILIGCELVMNEHSLGDCQPGSQTKACCQCLSRSSPG